MRFIFKDDENSHDDLRLGLSSFHDQVSGVLAMDTDTTVLYCIVPVLIGLSRVLKNYRNALDNNTLPYTM